eukprot:5902655-Alexandrium_andersonii.AAC.1
MACKRIPGRTTAHTGVTARPQPWGIRISANQLLQFGTPQRSTRMRWPLAMRVMHDVMRSFGEALRFERCGDGIAFARHL